MAHKEIVLTPPQQLTKETALSRSGNKLMFSAWETDEYNPDRLSRSKAGGLKIYQDMVTDPRVKSALMRLKSESLLPEFVVKPGDDTPSAIEHADFVRHNFETTDTPWQDILWSLMDFLNVGLTLAEIILEPVDGKWMLKDIKSKDPNSFVLLQDEFRNVTGVKVDVINGAVIPYDKFVHIAWMSNYGNPYGTSHLKAAYVYHWALKTLWKARLMFAERFGEPWIVGRTPKDNLDDTAESQFWDDLKSLHTDGVIKLPDGYEVDIREASSKGEIFETTTKALERNIVIAILGSHLQVEEGASGNLGGGSASSVHAQGSSLLVDMIRDRLLSGVQNLIRKLVVWNYGSQDVYPYPELVSQSDDKSYQDIAAERVRLETYERLSDRGVEIPLSAVKEEFEIPEVDGDEPLFMPLQQPQESQQQVLPFTEKKPQVRAVEKQAKELARVEEVGKQKFVGYWDKARSAMAKQLKKKVATFAVSKYRGRRRRT